MNKSKHMTTVEADLLFTKINSIKKKTKGKVSGTVSDRMEFYEFMSALKQIGAQLYPTMDKDEAMLTLIQEKILPLEK